MSEYFPITNPLRGNVIFQRNLSNYVIKTDLKKKRS